MGKLINVMAARVDGKVVLWEVSPEHPGGEVYISGDGRSVQVALTPAVNHLLEKGSLVQVVIASSPATPDDVPQQAVEPAKSKKTKGGG